MDDMNTGTKAIDLCDVPSSTKKCYIEILNRAKAYREKYGYKIPTKSDLTSRTRMVMVEIDGDICDALEPEILGTIIRLDDIPIKDGSVYYHCIHPYRKEPCFVPLEEFLDETSDLVSVWAGPKVQFWIKK